MFWPPLERVDFQKKKLCSLTVHKINIRAFPSSRKSACMHTILKVMLSCMKFCLLVYQSTCFLEPGREGASMAEHTYSTHGMGRPSKPKTCTLKMYFFYMYLINLWEIQVVDIAPPPLESLKYGTLE